MKTKYSVLTHILFWVGIVIIFYPILYIIGNAFKPLREAYQSSISLLPIPFTWENFVHLFESLPIVQITLNTFLIATVVTLLKLLLGFLAAYAFVYYQIKGKRVLYMLIISTMFIPFTVTMIPNYILMSQLNLVDNPVGVILPQIADAIGVFLLTQTMRGIPVSILEAARLDKIKHRVIMRSIVFPLVKHSITSTGIWFFILSWNEFVWPVLILKSVENYTLPLAMQTFVSSEGGTNFTIAMAISLLTMLVPLTLYTLFQKYIISPFISSGIK